MTRYACGEKIARSICEHFNLGDDVEKITFSVDFSGDPVRLEVTHVMTNHETDELIRTIKEYILVEQDEMICEALGDK